MRILTIFIDVFCSIVSCIVIIFSRMMRGTLRRHLVGSCAICRTKFFSVRPLFLSGADANVDNSANAAVGEGEQVNNHVRAAQLADLARQLLPLHVAVYQVRRRRSHWHLLRPNRWL